MKRIRTVLYGDQSVSPAELEVLHTPSLQRLYGLHQLGLTDRVFIDASHSRLHHVVGVLAQVDKLVNAIVRNVRRTRSPFKIGNSNSPRVIDTREVAREVDRKRPVIRLIGLLHDLTHAPFGHTIEDEIQLLESKHDEPQRQADAFYRLICQLISWLAADAALLERAQTLCPSLPTFLGGGIEREPPPPGQVAEVIALLLSDATKTAAGWRLSRLEFATLLAQLDYAMTGLLHLEALHKSKLEPRHLPNTKEYSFQTALRQGLASTMFAELSEMWAFVPHRDAYMLDIVGNTVCADLLDYAKRDSHFAGLQLTYDADRIAENFTLVTWDPSGYEFERTGERRSTPPGHKDPFEGWCLRTAISLFSHKYRTDVPGELMNLLTARFHLYERAIFHPTKCAAGAMLGTALQMLGWRRGAGGKTPAFPDHLRSVGDDVFLHDLRASLRLLVAKLSDLPPETTIADEDVSSLSPLDSAHNGLVAYLLQQRVGTLVSATLTDLAGAAAILDRIGARRFARPVFRALPSSHDLKLEVGAEGLARTFLNADTRYQAEREIERAVTLPPGSIFIHCPPRATAAKIANVLLVRRLRNGDDEICKLRDISRLDPEVFGKHESAIKAVEQMYRSMWRLVAYVNPEHIGQHIEISNAVGRVLFRTLDVHDHYVDSPDLHWDNDPHLEAELAESSEAAEARYFAETVAVITQAFEELVNAGHVPALDRLMKQIDRDKLAYTDVMSAVQSLLGKAHTSEEPAVGFERLLDVITTYFDKRSLSPRKQRGLRRRYESDFARFNPAAIADITGRLESSIRATPAALEQNQGTKLRELINVLDGLFRKHGVIVDSNAGVDDLFGVKK